MLYNSNVILILEIIYYFVVYVIAIPVLFAIIINILIGILKLRNEQNDNKLFIGSIIISIILSIILSNNVNILFGRTTTSINGKKDSDLKSRINQIVDLREKETEIIYAETKDINTYTEKVRIIERIRRGNGEYSHKYKEYYKYYYYLNIRDGEYIIPLTSEVTLIEIEDLLYNEDYGEQANFTNEIEVYKNTKYLKSINGINIGDYEKIEKFSNDKEYKIKITINNEGYLGYETEGCTLDEYINNKDVCVAIYNESDDLIGTTFQIFGATENLNKTFKDNLNISTLARYCYPDGKYYIYVCERDDFGKIEPKSNAVELIVEKRKAIDFKIIEK